MNKSSLQKDRSKIIALILCFVMGACFICLFSYSTSFLYPFFWGNDSAHFLTVGKAWGSGLIPYRDLFEHKGPIIYFIDLLGYNVESEQNVSAKYRQALLSEYINRKIISKEWAETAISNLIKYNRGRVTKWGAIRKWREDLEFLNKDYDSSAFKGKRILGTQRESE